MNRIGLIGAMSSEVAPLLDMLEDAVEERVGTYGFRTGKLYGVPVVVGCCGIGKVNAAMGAQTMLLRYKPGFLLHVGVGGSLTKRLGIGDVVVASDCVQYDVDTTALGDPLGMVSSVERVDFPCDERAAARIFEAAQEHCAEGYKVVLGRVATGDRFLTHAEDKKYIVDNFGALTCDQESCAIVQACLINKVPAAVIRAVSDASDEAQGDEFRANVGRVSDIAAGIALSFIEKYGSEFV